MSALSYSLVPHRSVIAVSGPDRVAFLQGLVTNDITKVGPERAVWAALLTPQGRFLNDMFVSHSGTDTLLLETERARAPALAQKLGLYKLRSQVTVRDRSAAIEVAVAYGLGAAAALGLSDGKGAAGAINGTTAYVDPRLAELGVRVLAPAGEAAGLLEALGFGSAPLERYEALRLRWGVPDGSRDLQLEKALPLESGFDELNGVDWKKGCYMGQELTARTKYRGLVKKRLFPVRVEGTLPASGAAIRRDGQEVGELRSGAGDRAIALLRIDAARGTTALIADGVRIVPEIPAWMHLPD